MKDPLFIFPTYVRSESDLDTTTVAIESFRSHHPETAMLVVDDCSPSQEHFEKLAARKDELKFGLHRKEENTGFSKTVNIGLRHALEVGLDAVLANADLHFEWPVVEEMKTTKDTKGNLAAVVGARLLYPNGLIQHAGVYFSMLHRAFEHRYKYAPHDLPEALHPCRCPVTGALQLIRHDTLEKVGIYDEQFNMAFEDVDYCVRVFEAGLECIYNPTVVAYHHESMFRGQASQQINDWHSKAWPTFTAKHAKTGLGEWVWPLV